MLFLPPETVIIGRDPSATVVVRSDHNFVSREHARLVWRSSAWHLEDLQSRNGVWVEGERRNDVEIATRVELTLGTPDAGVVLLVEPEAERPRDRAACDLPDFDLSDTNEYAWKIETTVAEKIWSLIVASLVLVLGVGIAVAFLYMDFWILGLVPGVVGTVLRVFGILSSAAYFLFLFFAHQNRSILPTAIFSGILYIFLVASLWGPNFGAEFTEIPSPSNLAGLMINTTVQGITLNGAEAFGIEMIAIEPANERGRQFMFILKLCVLLSYVRMITHSMRDARTRVIVATNREFAIYVRWLWIGTASRLSRVGDEEKRRYAISEVAQCGKQIEGDE